MGKSFRTVVLALIAGTTCFSASALSLTMRNGHVIPDVRIEGILPNAIQVRTYDNAADSIGFQTVRYSDMTNQTREEVFQYIRNALKQLYPDFSGQQQQQQSAGTASHAAGDAGTSNTVQIPLAPSQSFSGAYAPLSGTLPNSNTVYLPGMPHNITLEAIAMLEGGTLGYADSQDSAFVTSPTHYGKIFVYGVYTVQGTSWTGTVYPTNKTIYHNVNIYPCYATSPEMAEKINNSVY